MRIFDFSFFNEIQICCDFAFYALKYFKFFIFCFCFCVDLKIFITPTQITSDYPTDNTGTFMPSMSILSSRFMLTFRLPTTSSFCRISSSKKVDYPKIRKFGDLPSSKHDDVISEGCISEANLQKASFGSIKSVSISVEFGFNLFWTTKSISILLLSEKNRV